MKHGFFEVIVLIIHAFCHTVHEYVCKLKDRKKIKTETTQVSEEETNGKNNKSIKK